MEFLHAYYTAFLLGHRFLFPRLSNLQFLVILAGQIHREETADCAYIRHTA